MLIAHLKRILRLNRLRLREPNGADDEFQLAATAQNLTWGGSGQGVAPSRHWQISGILFAFQVRA